MITRSTYSRATGSWVATTTVRPSRCRATASSSRREVAASKPGGRLVEEEHRGVPEQRPRHRDPLPLAAAEAAAPLAHPGVVAVRKQPDETVGVGPPGGRLDLRATGLGPAEPDVLRDRRVHERRLLRHQRDRLTHRPDGEVAEVLAVDADGSVGGLDVPREQPGDGGLAGPTRADQADHLAGLDAERRAVQRVPRRAGVADPDAGQLDGTTDVDEIASARRVLGQRLVEQLDHPLDAGGGGVERREQVAERPERRVALHEQGEERHQPAEGEPVGGQRPRAERDHGQGADQLGQVGQRQEHRPDPGPDQLGGGDREVLPVVVRDGVRLAVVGLDEGRVRQPLLGDRAERAGPAPALAGDVLDQAGEVGGDPPQQRRGDHRDQRQLPLQPEQRAGVDREPQHRAGPARELADHERLDGGGVRGEPRHRVPEPVAVVHVAGVGEHVAEDLGAQPDEELLRDPGGQVVVDAGDHRAEQVQPDVHRRDPDQRAEGGRDEHVVHQLLEQHHLEHRDERGGRQQRDQEQQPPAQRAQIRPEPTDHLPDGHRRRRTDERRGVRRRPEQRHQLLEPPARAGRRARPLGVLHRADLPIPSAVGAGAGAVRVPVRVFVPVRVCEWPWRPP